MLTLQIQIPRYTWSERSSDTTPWKSQNICAKIITKEKRCNCCKNILKIFCILGCHLKLHSGEKPRKCNHCQNKIKTSSILEGHVKLHSGLNPKKMPTLQIQISRYTWFERSYDNTPRWKSQNINFKILTKENRCNRCKKYIEDFLHFGMSHWITLLEKAQNAFMWIFTF